MEKDGATFTQRKHANLPPSIRPEGMAMAKSITRVLNDAFVHQLHDAFLKVFPDSDIRTEYQFLSMAHVTTRADGKPFNKTQHAWIAAFESGYFAAMDAARGRK